MGKLLDVSSRLLAGMLGYCTPEGDSYCPVMDDRDFEEHSEGTHIRNTRHDGKVYYSLAPTHPVTVSNRVRYRLVTTYEDRLIRESVELAKLLIQTVEHAENQSQVNQDNQEP